MVWLAAIVCISLAADARAPAVIESRSGDAYVIEGSFPVFASAEVVWKVLSDYAQFPSFVSSVTKSTIISRHADAVVIDQEAIAKLGPFSRILHLRLAVREVPGHALSFRDVSGRDFVRQEGSWSIAEQSAGEQWLGCIVTYHLLAEPRVRVPQFIGGSIFRDTAIHLLSEVRDEIEKRAALTLSGDHP